MLAYLIDYPVINEKKNVAVADARESKLNLYFSKNFEIQQPEEDETYQPQSPMLMHNKINAFVVDWEIPKMEG